MADGLHSPLTKHGGWPVVDGVATSYNSAAVVARNKYLVALVEAVCPSLGRLVVAAVNPKPMHYIDGEVSPLSDTVPSLCHLYLSPLLPTPSPTLASLSAKGDRANLVARGRRCRGRHGRRHSWRAQDHGAQVMREAALQLGSRGRPSATTFVHAGSSLLLSLTPASPGGRRAAPGAGGSEPPWGASTKSA